MNFIKCIILLLAGLISVPMSGQFYPFSKLVKEADICYDDQQYALALQHYNSASQMDGKMHKKSVFKYADAAFNLNSLSLSENLFMQYLDNDKVDREHEALYKLILIRQKQGRYEEAILDCNIYLSEFENDSPETTKEVRFIRESCQWAVDANLEAIVDSVQNMSNVNSGYSDQAPYIFGDSLYYNSIDHQVLRDKQKTYISKIYKESKELVEVKGLSEENSLSHPSFSNDGKYFFFTVCEQELDNSYNCDIYFSFVGPDNEIGVARKVLHAVNSDAYSSTHPVAVTLDTSIHLYFASDMPGGKGGFDIYKATLNQEMTLMSLENLEKINSERDEYAPFLNFNANDLYFSSNGHEGYGGFDIFKIDLDLTYECATRRILKTLATDQRHVVAAGDRVLFRAAQNNEGIIERVEPRHGVVCRTSRGRQHVLVANVDQLLIISSAAEPTIKPHLIDRFLVTAEKWRIRPIICINKIDLVDPADLQPLVGVYARMGYRTILLSVHEGTGVEQIRELVRGGHSVVMGQSGVGKSSLLNTIEPDLQLRVNTVSAETQKGKHTTTAAQLVPLEMGGYIVDTPGIRQFQLWDVIPEEVVGFFRDLRPYVSLCQFPDCSHTHEGGCAIKHAVADGGLDARRYESYCQMLDE